MAPMTENITRPAVEGQHPPLDLSWDRAWTFVPSPARPRWTSAVFGTVLWGRSRPVRAQLGGNGTTGRRRPLDGGAHWSLGTRPVRSRPCIALGAANVTAATGPLVYRSCFRFTTGAGAGAPVLGGRCPPTCPVLPIDHQRVLWLTAREQLRNPRPAREFPLGGPPAAAN